MGSFAPGAQIFDVTVPVSPSIFGWPGQPATETTPLSRVADGAGANVSWVQLSSHAGTHVDANWHFIDDGRKLLEIPVERWCGPAYVAHIPDEVDQISAADLESAGIPEGTERLLLRTRNSHVWDDWDGASYVPFREDYVGVLPDAARWLVDRGVRLVGTDSLSVGTFGPQNRDTHLTLLGNDVLVIELLDLSRIEAGPYELVCLPLKLAIGDGAPARVLLVRES